MRMVGCVKAGEYERVSLKIEVYTPSNMERKALQEQPSLGKGWLESLGLAADDYSTHSLRKTKASAIYDATKNVEAVLQLLGHASVAATSAYLGIEQAKALDIAKNHKMF